MRGGWRWTGGGAATVSYLNRVDVLQWRSESVSDPPVDLHGQKLGFISDSLLSGLKLLRQNLDHRLQGHDLRPKLAADQQVNNS